MQLLIPILTTLSLLPGTANSVPLVSTTTLMIIQTNIQTITVQSAPTPASTSKISGFPATITGEPTLLAKKRGVINGLRERANYGKGGSDDTVQRPGNNGKERRANNYGKHSTNNVHWPTQTQS